MALATGALKSSLVSAGFSDAAAQAVANAIEAMIKSGTVTVSAGQAFSGASSAGPVTGNTTSTATGSIT